MKTIYILIFLFSITTNSYTKERDFSSIPNKKTEQTIIKSNKLDKKDDNIIKAIGDVEIKKGDKIFNANEVEYNKNTKVIKANSEVRVIDKRENNIFFSETAEMTDDFNIANFNNGLIIFKNGSNISSPNIKKTGEHTLVINKSNYSVCPTERYNINLTYEEIMSDLKKEKTPLFYLESSKIYANTEKKELSLWGSSVWFWKIPIFYIPYLKTGLAFQEQLNGFEIPGVENTSHYGYGVYIPYNITTKYQKAKITPKIYTDGNYLLNVKYNIHPDIENKDQLNKWNINFIGDITNDNGRSEKLTNAYGITEKNEGNYKNLRGFAALDGYYNFNDYWNFDYNTGIVSDRYYLRDYYQDNLSYIESNLKFTKIDLKNIENFNYFQFSNLFYQELLENDIEYDTPRYAPVINFNLQNTIIKNNFNNLFYKIKINTTNLFRNSGTEYNRLTLTPTINNTLKTNIGIINTNFELRGDLYIINEVGNSNSIYKHNTSRVLPQLNIEWRKSFNLKSFLFQPIIKYSGSPNFNNFEKYIPNEDSKPQGISFEDIFSNNRFIGYDRQEFGNRITYGFETNILNVFSFGLAQGYRDNIENNIEKLLGFEDNLSDYVGYGSYIINNYFDIYYRFLIDKNDFIFKKNEVTMNLNTEPLDIYLIYTNINEKLSYEKTQQQINLGVFFTLFTKWKFDISGIVDIKNHNRLLESKVALIYDGDCAIWEINYKNYNPLSDTNKSTSINFNFNIKFI